MLFIIYVLLPQAVSEALSNMPEASCTGAIVCSTLLFVNITMRQQLRRQ